MFTSVAVRFDHVTESLLGKPTTNVPTTASALFRLAAEMTEAGRLPTVTTASSLCLFIFSEQLVRRARTQWKRPISTRGERKKRSRISTLVPTSWRHETDEQWSPPFFYFVSLWTSPWTRPGIKGRCIHGGPWTWPNRSRGWINAKKKKKCRHTET